MYLFGLDTNILAVKYYVVHFKTKAKVGIFFSDKLGILKIIVNAGNMKINLGDSKYHLMR